MTPLIELGRKHRTDKVDYHSYLPFYEELFRNRNVKRLLEIGIGSKESMSHVPNYQPGASLRMWADFFPEAEIHGLDNDSRTFISDKRIWCWLADYRKAEELWAALSAIGAKTGSERFDVIIDDGFHEPQDQIFCANILVPYLPPNGVYVIEDVRAGNKETVQKGLLYPSRVVEFDITRLPDDRIILIEPGCR